MKSFMRRLLLAFERCGTYLYFLFEKSINFIHFQTQIVPTLFSLGRRFENQWAQVLINYIWSFWLFKWTQQPSIGHIYELLGWFWKCIDCSIHYSCAFGFIGVMLMVGRGFEYIDIETHFLRQWIHVLSGSVGG